MTAQPTPEQRAGWQDSFDGAAPWQSVNSLIDAAFAAGHAAALAEIMATAGMPRTDGTEPGQPDDPYALIPGIAWAAEANLRSIETVHAKERKALEARARRAVAACDAMEAERNHAFQVADELEVELARVTAERDFARNDALAQSYVVRDLRAEQGERIAVKLAMRLDLDALEQELAEVRRVVREYVAHMGGPSRFSSNAGLALGRVAGDDAGTDAPRRGPAGPQTAVDPTSGQGDRVCAQPGNDGAS